MHLVSSINLVWSTLCSGLSPENWSGENVSGGPKILVRRTNIFNGKMVLGLIFHGNTVPHRKKWSARRTENFSPPDQYFQWKNGPSTNFPWKYGPSSKKMVRSGMARAVFQSGNMVLYTWIRLEFLLMLKFRDSMILYVVFDRRSSLTGKCMWLVQWFRHTAMYCI